MTFKADIPTGNNSLMSVLSLAVRVSRLLFLLALILAFRVPTRYIIIPYFPVEGLVRWSSFHDFPGTAVISVEHMYVRVRFKFQCSS